MNEDATVVLTITRTELGMIVDSLELMEDAEHLRPWRQELAAALLEKVAGMSGHAAPDFLWTILLILFIIVLLRMLGAV